MKIEYEHRIEWDIISQGELIGMGGIGKRERERERERERCHETRFAAIEGKCFKRLY
jgi:hypothetical protein